MDRVSTFVPSPNSRCEDKTSIGDVYAVMDLVDGDLDYVPETERGHDRGPPKGVLLLMIAKEKETLEKIAEPYLINPKHVGGVPQTIGLVTTLFFGGGAYPIPIMFTYVHKRTAGPQGPSPRVLCPARPEETLDAGPQYTPTYPGVVGGPWRRRPWMRCPACRDPSLEVLRSKAVITTEHIQFMAYQLLRGLKSAGKNRSY